MTYNKKSGKASKKRSIRRHSRGARVQKGGDVIGSGGYGCVLRPNVACVGSKSSMMNVGKIVDRNNNDIEPFIIQETQIREIPDYKKHIVVIENVCDSLDMNSMTKEQKEDINKCMTKMQIQNTDDLVQYVQPYGGMTFAEYRKREPRQLIANAAPWYIRLLESVKFLNDNGFVHMDIKAENIVLSITYKLARLIDFNFLCYIDDAKNMKNAGLFVREFNNMVVTGYPPWPLEFYLFNYKPKPGTNNVIAMYDSMLVPFESDHAKNQLKALLKYNYFDKNLSYLNLFKQKFQDDANEIHEEIKKINNIQNHKERVSEIEKFKRGINQTLDIFSTGVVLLADINLLLRNTMNTGSQGVSRTSSKSRSRSRSPKSRSDPNVELSTELAIFIINHMTRVYYKHRLPINDCIAEIKNICSKYDLRV
jgi:serine/threonine protein kinase